MAAIGGLKQLRVRNRNMQYMKKYLVLACMLMFGSLVVYPARGGTEHSILIPDLLHLEYTGWEKHVNGRISRSFAVHPPADSADNLKVLFRENSSSDLYTAELKNNRFTITADKTVAINLFVVAQTDSSAGGRIHVTTTDFVLFGKSGTPVIRKPAAPTDAGLLASIPHITLDPGRYYYWLQTGTPLTFRIKSPFDVSDFSPMSLADNRISPLEPDISALGFVYTPPHDDRLRQAGNMASRQDMVFTHINRCDTRYHLAYDLLLHRSLRAYHRRYTGILVALSGLVLSAGLILNKRRAPWWKE